MSKSFFTIMFGMGLLTAAAQQDTTYLREVVITGNRSERTLDEVDRSVSIISQQEIERFPYQNVAELLSQETGIYVIGQGQNPGTNQSLFLRGANSNQVNVLIDGVRLSDPSTPGGALDLSELSLVNVERVEILRGSHGTMYGTSGIGGVINIITKKAEEGWNLDIMSQGGVFKENGQSLKHGVRGRYQLQNGLYAAGGYENLIVNGLNAAMDTASGGSLPTDEDNFNKLDFYGQLGYEGDRLGLNVFYKDIHQRTDLDQGAFNDDDNYFLELDRTLLNYQASYDFNDGSISYQGGWSTLERKTDNDSTLIDSNGNYDGIFSETGNTGETLTNELQVLFGKNPVSVLLGLGQYREQMNLTSYTFFNGFVTWRNLENQNIGADSYYGFAQVILSGDLISDNLAGWQLTLGSRLTSHSQFGSQFSYEVTPGYHFQGGKVFFSLSSGYKNPSLIQLFDPATSPGYFTNRGNENLSPEESISMEAGWEQRLGVLDVRVSLFQTHIQNVIEYVYLWNSITKPIGELDFNDYSGDTYINLAAMQTRGLELGLELQITDDLELSADYSYLQGEMRFEDDNVSDLLNSTNYVQLFSNGQFLSQSANKEDQLVRRPSNLLHTRLTYQPSKALRASLAYRYVDSRPDSFYDTSLGPFGALNTLSVASYHLFDVFVGYTVSTSLDLGLRVENLLNSDYREIQGFNTRGRGIYLKVSYHLSRGK